MLSKTIDNRQVELAVDWLRHERERQARKRRIMAAVVKPRLVASNG